MSTVFGKANGFTGESSPSVGLAVVDSMAGSQIKAFASHAQAFYRLARLAYVDHYALHDTRTVLPRARGTIVLI